MVRRFVGLLVLLVVCFRLVPAAGQDIHRFSQFFFNPSLLNPSLTGIDGQPSVFLSYRKQWMGLRGAPELSSFSFQTPGKNRIAIGLNAGAESAGLLKSTGFRISSGYNLPAGDGAYFRFGMSAGAVWNRVDVAGLQFGSPDPDPVTGSLARSNTGIVASAGVSYHTKTFHIGLSAPALFEPDYITGEAFSQGKFKPLDQLILHSSYRSYLSGNQNVVEYYLNYRLNKILPSQLEVATILHLGGKGWVGASWKQGPGLSGLVGYNLSKTFALGYSYTMKGTDGNIAFPGHEVQLGILFGQRLKGTPAYSFINSEKESRGNRKPGMVASANRKPGYVPLQKGAVIAKAPSAKPMPPKPGGPAPGKPTVAAGAPVKKPSTPVIATPEKPQVVKPAPQTPPEQPVVVSTPSQEKKEPVPVKQEPTAVPQEIAKPAVTDAPPQLKKEPVAPQQQEPVPVVKAETATPVKPQVQQQKEPVPVAKAEPATPAAGVQQKNAETPVKPQPIPAVTPGPDKAQGGRPRLTQQAGAFDEQLPGETPAKPENKPTPKEEEEEGEDVAGLHGTRHVQDSLQEVDEQERLSRLTLHNENPNAAHTGEAPHAERHEFVRRGGHQSEMSAGDFVIVGVFKTEVNAKRWADGLKAMGFKDIDYGFLTERTVWYVHFAGIDDLAEARSVRDQYRKLKVFRDAWLLTVQE